MKPPDFAAWWAEQDRSRWQPHPAAEAAFAAGVAAERARREPDRLAAALADTTPAPECGVVVVAQALDAAGVAWPNETIVWLGARIDAAIAGAVAAERARVVADLQSVADEYDRQAGRVELGDEIVRRAYVARDMIAALAGDTDAAP